MGLSTWARKIDNNQPEIVKGLRELALPVKLVSHCPKGVLDIITGYNGILYWVEIKKSLDEPLTGPEQETFDIFRGYPVVKTHKLEHLLKLMGAL